MMKKLIAALMIAVLALTGAGFAGNVAGSDWYMQALDTTEYPYHAFIDVNGDGVPLLIVSTTQEAFIGDEDRAILYACAEDGPKQVMEIGGNGGEKFYCNAEEHTLTHYYRFSGEGHMEVYNVVGDELALVTRVDSYGPFHAPEAYDNQESVYLQDGETIDEATSAALWDLYANDADEVAYEAANGLKD